MTKLESPYLIRKEIPLEDLQRVAQSKVYVRQGSVVLFDDQGEDSGKRHTGPFLFREVVGFAGEPLGFERILDQKVVRRPGLKPNDKFTTTGTDSDAYTPLGDAWQKGILNIEGPILVCAGIAEGYRLHEATSLPVACCVGENKIPKIAKLIKSLVRNPDEVFIAVDNDKAGYIAALRSGLPYIMPTEEKDFSDVYQEGGGVVAVRAEARNIRQPLPAEEREAELDRLLKREPSTNTRALDPLVLYDERMNREALQEGEQERQAEAAGQGGEDSPTQLLLAKTDFTELGFSGMLQVNRKDCKKIQGYQHFQRMAELLGIGVYTEDHVDQWILSSAESMTLLVAMVKEGLGDVLGEMPPEYAQLNAHIYEGITDGLFDHSDIPGGAPAFITLSESAKGTELRLQSGFDAEIRKACIAAKGYYDKALQCWRFPVSNGDELNETIKALANNPLRQMVFLMPDQDPKWMIGTPSRIEKLQTNFLNASGMVLTQDRSMAEERETFSPPPTQKRVGQAADATKAPAEQVEPDTLQEPVPASTTSVATSEAPGETHEALDATTAFAEEEKPDNEPEKPVNTLATIRLIKDEGHPALILRSPFNPEVVNICRKVKRLLDSAFPDQPRAQFNKNESGAWHFPVSNRKALALALDTLCHEDCDEISVVTPKGKILATQAHRASLMAAMQLNKEGTAQEARGKPLGAPESPPDKPAHTGRTAAAAPVSDDASPEIDLEEEAFGIVDMQVKAGGLELVLKSGFDNRVVAACKRIKAHLDAANPDQPKATFNREKDKAWRFPVNDEKSLNDAISALCFESTPPLLLKTQYGSGFLTVENHSQLMQWVSAEATTKLAKLSRSTRPRSGANRHRTRERSREKGREYQGSRASRASGGRKEWTQSAGEFRARMTFHQGGRNDYFMVRMNRRNPVLQEICEKVHGEYRRRDQAWHVPIFSTGDLKHAIESICGCDMAGIEVVIEKDDGKPTAYMALPENCNHLVRHFNQLRKVKNPSKFEALAPGQEEGVHQQQYAEPSMR